MAEYVNVLLGTLVDAAQQTLTVTTEEILGMIDPADPVVPHKAVYLRVSESTCLATTAGLSARGFPLPVSDGFQYFEVCAVTSRDSPRVLWLLSRLGRFMQSIAAPALLATREMTSGWGAAVPKPAPLLPYQTLRLGGDETRFLLVPRWRFTHPSGPPVEMVEPLPLRADQWPVLERLSLAGRGPWVQKLGDTRAAWDPIIT